MSMLASCLGVFTGLLLERLLGGAGLDSPSEPRMYCTCMEDGQQMHEMHSVTVHQAAAKILLCCIL